jgi:hypothetical protein
MARVDTFALLFPAPCGKAPGLPLLGRILSEFLTHALYQVEGVQFYSQTVEYSYHERVSIL